MRHCAESAEEEKLIANLWWPAGAATWDRTASCPKESVEAGRESLQLLNFRRALVTHYVLSLSCPLPFCLLGHGAIKTFEFNFSKLLSGDWSQHTSTVLKCDLWWCCCSEWRASAEMPGTGCSHTHRLGAPAHSSKALDAWESSTTTASAVRKHVLSLPDNVSRCPILHLQLCLLPPRNHKMIPKLLPVSILWGYQNVF